MSANMGATIFIFIYLYIFKQPMYTLAGFELTTHSSYLLGDRRRWYH
jgi:hypothetical protein